MDCTNNANNKQVGLKISARMMAVNQSPQQVHQIRILVSHQVTVEYSDAEEGVFESPVREVVAWAGGGR